MRYLPSILGMCLLIVLAAFGSFGFLATFEPTDQPGTFLAFRVGYAILVLGCLAGIYILIRNVVRGSS